MQIRIIIFLILFITISCQTQNSKTKSTNNEINKTNELNVGPSNKKESKNDVAEKNPRWKCNEEVCLQLRNHDPLEKSFEIYMINSVPTFGFQCDLPGVKIVSSSGGLLKEHDYQTSNSETRLLSFSMQAKPIPVGMGILTKVIYENAEDEVCMVNIVFAGIGGSKLSNNTPDCMKLD